jgi:hypothetical protein
MVPLIDERALEECYPFSELPGHNSFVETEVR